MAKKIELPWQGFEPQTQNKTYNQHGPTVSHCAFSSNLFHGHLAQIYIDQKGFPALIE